MEVGGPELADRMAAPEQTVERVLAKAPVLGLTRLSDVSDLDVLGIPNYAAICPTLNYPPTEGMVSVASGKGTTRIQAKASALMEAVERYSCRYDRRFTIRGSFARLSRSHNVAHPGQFVTAPGAAYGHDDEIEWVGGRSLFRGDPVLVPAWLVFAPYRPWDRLPVPASGSAGAAAGNSLEEAVLQGLYELIERDAIALACYSRQARRVDATGLANSVAGEILAAFERRQVHLQVRDITTDVEVPTYEAVGVDSDPRRLFRRSLGQATNLDPEVAVLKAALEVSQSRVTDMAGIREDMMGRAAALEPELASQDWVTVEGDGQSAPLPPGRPPGSVHEAIDRVLQRLTAVGVPDAYAVDLTRPELEIPVVRVLVPLLETELGQCHGPRAERAMRRSRG